MQIQVFDNADKDNRPKSQIKEHLLQFGQPFSILIIGLSDCGKTNLIKNIINMNDFKIIYVMHAELDSHDYDDIPHINYDIGEDYIERFREYADIPKLLIIDDIDFRNFKKETQNWFYKMLTYTRTHTNLSIISTVQDAIYYPPIIRRTFPIIVIYKYIKLEPLRETQAFNVIDSKEIDFTRKKFMKSDYDFIIVNNKTKRAWVSLNNNLQLLKDNTLKHDDDYYVVDDFIDEEY